MEGKINKCFGKQDSMLKFIGIIILFCYRIFFGLRRRLCTLFAFLTFAEFGKNSQFLPNVLVKGHGNIFIGSDVCINDRVILQALGNARIIIGNSVVLSFGCMLITGNRDLVKDSNHEWKSIVIEDGAWIGAGVIILPGVTIGNGAVIAAGAVVTDNVPSDRLFAGVPAEFKRRLK